MAPQHGIVPVIDLKGLSSDANDQKIIAAQVKDAFTNIGFVAVKNHGMPEKLVSDAWKYADEFFDLKDEVKHKYIRTEQLDCKYGWVPLASEKLYNRDGIEQEVGDYKEGYDVIPARQIWPTEVKKLETSCMEFYDSARTVAEYMFRMIALALDLKDAEYFNTFHHMGTATNLTNVRYLRYPPVPGSGLQRGQMRCGEHTDFGSITLLIQDENGGLEVMRRDGKWFEVAREPDTIMVNIGDLMQRWTADQLISTRHRVRMVEDEITSRRTRRSLVFFAAPDMKAVVRCVDGSNKYPDIDANEYIFTRAAEVRKK